MISYDITIKEKLNQDIASHFPHIFPITDDMHMAFEGVARLVMLDRYTQKDMSLVTLSVGDLVITVVKHDPKFPARGIGRVTKIEGDYVFIKVEDEFLGLLSETNVDGTVKRGVRELDKPLEIYYEQIASRVAHHLGEGETPELISAFENELRELNLIPAGRVLFGAGSQANVTYFNCFVMPFVHDSRGGISKHRSQVMEIMSRGGGVGTNGSSLRPKNALAKGVNGRSSGAVSWLNDLAQLTHLVEQGGSRRGAQMIMLADWHPDIIEFIVSKMQNPRILRFIMETIDNDFIRRIAKNKLKFTPLSDEEYELYRHVLRMRDQNTLNGFSKSTVHLAETALNEEGKYTVNDSEFLSGANISVAITKEFMQAVENDEGYALRFPDLDNYTPEQKIAYDEQWMHVGDVREWEALGFPVKTYRTIRAKDLWNLINICATYSAEPGIFFIDNANEMTNAIGYGQKVVCTNPCGEQPLAPYSVCNLAALNLANFADRENEEVLWDKLAQTIDFAVRMQDNVIDKTYYFLDENKEQALGERRVGMGVMGLHDLLIWCGKRYGSPDANDLVERLFKFIAEKAYETSIALAKEKGSFPFLDQRGSREKLIQSGYIQKLSKELQDAILEHGIRNSHLLTIAPTGSTGTMVGVSTGLEPYFAFKYYRSGRLGKHIEVNAKIVENYLNLHPEYSEENLPTIFVSAMELNAEEHADVQCIIQRWVDSSISKTVNAPKGYSVEDVERVYMRLYKGGAKGGTVYVDGSRDAQVLSLKRDDAQPKQVDMIDDLGLSVEEVHIPKEDTKPKLLRSDRQDREIGIEDGNICPICLEGVVKDLGGCNTCTNCNAQLKCGY